MRIDEFLERERAELDALLEDIRRDERRTMDALDAMLTEDRARIDAMLEDLAAELDGVLSLPDVDV